MIHGINVDQVVNRYCSHYAVLLLQMKRRLWMLVGLRWNYTSDERTS